MSGLFPRILRVHQWIYKHTDGLLGHRLLFGNPTLLLRTTGRRTGLPRTAALTYARDGDDYLIVASNGGRPKPPTWLANLKAVGLTGYPFAPNGLDILLGFIVPIVGIWALIELGCLRGSAGTNQHGPDPLSSV